MLTTSIVESFQTLGADVRVASSPFRGFVAYAHKPATGECECAWGPTIDAASMRALALLGLLAPEA